LVNYQLINRLKKDILIMKIIVYFK
jgi:hypothetical protein